MKNGRLLIICFLVVAFITGCNSGKSVYNITEYGAKGDGKMVNTSAINSTIKKCSENGGGVVLIPSGNFISGTVLLLSNVNLHLDPGAKLTGSKDTSDYMLMKKVYFNEGYRRYGLIYSGDAKNISITGTGEINGNGTYFMNGPDKPQMGRDYDRKFTRQGEDFMKQGSVIEDGPVTYNFRPGLMIIIERCENIHIEDVVLSDSPEWTVKIGDCDDANIHGISILNNPLIPNNDGIHCTNSRNIRISDCNIVAGDDAIIVTGFSDQPSPTDPAWKVPASGNKTGYAENITVNNCVLSSRSACIRVGYGHHPIRNVIFSNLVMYDSNRGIGIFARDNSSIENVLFTNIIINNRLHSGHWWGKGEPVHISSIKDSPNGVVGKINNIRFYNIMANSEAGILIYGTNESQINNIHFDKIQLTIHSGKFTETYGGNFDLRPVFANEYAIFKHDIPGLYAQFVNKLSISDMELSWDGKQAGYFTNGIELRNFTDASIDRFKGRAAFETNGLAAIKAVDGSHLSISDCTSTGINPLVIKENVK